MLFLGPARISTWVTLLVFVAIYAAKRDGRALLSAWAWLSGFEGVYQATALSLGHPLPFGKDGPIFLVVLGALSVVWTFLAGVRASLPLLGLAIVIGAVWVMLGFHSNQHTMIGFDPTAEALNESAKTLWALGYLWPLLRYAERPSRREGELGKSKPDVV